MFPLYIKLGIEFRISDLNVCKINEINFFVVHELGIWNEKDFDFEKRRRIVNSESVFELWIVIWFIFDFWKGEFYWIKSGWSSLYDSFIFLCFK